MHVFCDEHMQICRDFSHTMAAEQEREKTASDSWEYQHYFTILYFTITLGRLHQRQEKHKRPLQPVSEEQNAFDGKKQRI